MEFSFTMDAGVNKDFSGYHYCCSSYAYFFFCASGLVSAADAVLRVRRVSWRREMLFVLFVWCGFALGTLIYDQWQHNHHFLAFLIGTLCALLNVQVVRERQAFSGPVQIAPEPSRLPRMGRDGSGLSVLTDDLTIDEDAPSSCTSTHKLPSPLDRLRSLSISGFSVSTRSMRSDSYVRCGSQEHIRSTYSADL